MKRIPPFSCFHKQFYFANAYCHSLSPFLNAIGNPWQELTIADVDDYLTAKRLVSIMPETYNHCYGALRFMYKWVLKLNWDEDEIPRMKRDCSLPTVLTKEEIDAIVTKLSLYNSLKRHLLLEISVIISLS